MRLCCSARCPHKKRHRAAINHLVGIRPRLYDKRLLAKKLWFSSKDLYFLHVLGGWRTHIIWSGIRYFSCFSDAANYGVHAAMSAVVFAISAFFVESKWLRIYFLCIAVGGTLRNGYFGEPRAAMGVIMGGMLMITVIAKKLESVIGRYIHIHQRFSCSSVIPISEAGTNISTRCAPLSIRPKTLPTRCVSKTGKE